MSRVERKKKKREEKRLFGRKKSNNNSNDSTPAKLEDNKKTESADNVKVLNEMKAAGGIKIDPAIMNKSEANAKADEAKRVEIDKAQEAKKATVEKAQAAKDVAAKKAAVEKTEEVKKADAAKTEPIQIKTQTAKAAKKSSGGIGGFFKKLLLTLVILLVIVYAAGVVVFSNRFNVNTTINGVDVSLKSPKQVEAIFAQRAKDCKIHIIEKKGADENFTGAQIGLTYNDDGRIKDLKNKQNKFLWFMGYITPEEYDQPLNVKYNAKLLNDRVEKFKLMQATFGEAPKSAYPVFDEKEKVYKPHKEVYGNKVKYTAFRNTLKHDILCLKDKMDMAKEGVYLMPKNKVDDPRLQKAITILDEYAKIKIVYDFKYEKKVLDGKDIVNMFDINTDGDYSVKLDKNKVREYVRGLSRKYSTYGDTRDFTTAQGKKIKVVGGSYGWLIDREKETDALYNLIKEKKGENDRKPIYQLTAMSRDKDDIGPNYIEINLSDQMMYLFINRKVVLSTNIVTGNPYTGHATPTGTYPINYKQRGATLRGPGYSSPVTYWMPFNSDIGIHDASWRGNWGSRAYLGDGSKGCINTPYSNVQYIYNHVEKGWPVVVHN